MTANCSRTVTGCAREQLKSGFKIARLTWQCENFCAAVAINVRRVLVVLNIQRFGKPQNTHCPEGSWIIKDLEYIMYKVILYLS